MLEIATIVLTVGAMLYHVFGVSIGVTGVVSSLLVLIAAIVFRTRRGMMLGAVMGGVLLLGWVAMWQADRSIDQRIYGKRAFDARVVSVNRQLDKVSIVVVDEEYGERLQVSVRGSLAVLPGDHLGVRGEVEVPEDFETGTGRIFAYQAFMESKGIVGIASSAIVGPVMSHSFSLNRFPTIVRYAFADVFARYVSFPFDGVLAGMTVGYQGGLPDYISDLFRNTGVLHVLVLSGYNITLLAGALAVVLKGLPFRMRNIVTIIAILMLVLVSGSGVAAVRAGIMGSIAVFAGLSIRTYQPMRALIISYIIS